MLLRDVMTRDVEDVGPEASLKEAAEKMRTLDVGALPVCEAGRLVGVITDRDLAVRHIATQHKDDCAVSSHMSKDNIQAVEESDDVATVIAAMERREVRRVPVTDKSGRLLGIIAQADIATCDDIPKAQVAEVVRMVSEPDR